MNLLESIADAIDALNEAVGKLATWAAFLLVWVVFTDVVMRYFFNTTFVFVQELEWHLFAFIFLIGAGYTLRHDQHVRVDIFYQRLRPRSQAWVNLIGTCVFLFPGCFLILKTSIPWAVSAYQIGEISPDPGGIPMRFIVKSFLPIGFSFLTLQGVSLACRSLVFLYRPESDPETAGAESLKPRIKEV